ncbi:hypothetical protein ACE6H2_019724 [Prunus campanulata]
MTVGQPMEAYDDCISNFLEAQTSKRTSSLKRIFPLKTSRSCSLFWFRCTIDLEHIQFRR